MLSQDEDGDSGRVERPECRTGPRWSREPPLTRWLRLLGAQESLLPGNEAETRRYWLDEVLRVRMSEPNR